MNWSRRHAGVLAILVAFGVLGVIYVRVTPLLETPDEPSHFSVVKYIADEGRLPPHRLAPADTGPVPVILPGAPVYYAPPLYYAMGALLIADLDTGGFAQDVVPNPNWARGWAPTPGRSAENKNVYVQTAAQRPPYAGWAAAMMRLRLFSLLLGGLTVAGVYVLARELWPSASGGTGQAWVLAATALVAFNPAFLFVTTGVTNDALLFALSAWALVLMVRLVSPAGVGDGWHVAGLGLVQGLGILTKQSMLAFLPLGGLAVLWSGWARGRSWRTALRWLALWGVLVVLVGGWWYAYNGLAYADPLGFEPHKPPTPRWTPPLGLMLRQLGQALQGYWGTFGWGLILADPVIYALFGLFSGIGFAGLVVRLREKGLHLRSDPTARKLGLLACAVLLNLAGLGLWLWRTSAPYGRLLFPALGPVAVLLVWGWGRWVGRRHARIFALIVALAMLGYALLVPGRYLRPAYASPVVPTSEAAGALPLDVVYDGGVRLLGYRVTPENLQPGSEVELALYWQALEPPDGNLMIFVQLAPQDPEQRVASLDHYLGTLRYPTSVWQTGDTIKQIHRLRIPQEAPAPGLYWFNIGLYREGTQERLAVRVDAAPAPGGVARIGPLRLRDPRPAPPDQRVDYRFGANIQLTGYDLETGPEGLLTVSLLWEATAEPEEGWHVFVHLLDAEGGLLAQHDGVPRQGEYPTWAWQPGERVWDAHTLDVPPGWQAGADALQVGLYRLEDGTRLPVYDGSGQRMTDDAALLSPTHQADSDGAHGD
jgi:4-amino-4-deoxy-L-arabinose transferase-like glycosyltransferase